MKRQIGFALILTLLIGLMPVASAATLIPGTLTRNISLHNSDDNPSIPGESPTTGLPSNNSVYLPILSQIDNNLEAIPQWGISFADIMYELPIQGQGWTRLTALFSDQYPDEVGPVRSGRVMHADLREEWDAALVHYGKQEAPGSNMKEILSKYGVTVKGLAIDGIGNKYSNYFSRVRYHAAPHNVTAYISKIKDMLVTTDYLFPQRPFKFTDDTNYGGTPALQFSVIHKKNKDTSSTFSFDSTLNGYQRFVRTGAYYDYLNPAKILSYSNVIVQRTKLTFNNSSMNPLLSEVIGSGAADIFISGQYIAGAWSRKGLTDRTVFYDQQGNEIALQRGKSWIIICDIDTEIVIGDIDSSMQNNLYADVSENENGERITTSIENQLDSQSNGNNADFTVQPDENASSNQQNINFATIKVPNKGPLNMRVSDSGKSDIITRIPNGSSVEVIDRGDEWTKVKYNGDTGYVMTSYLIFQSKSSVH